MELNPLRNISLPSVNDVLESPRLKRLVETLSHNVVVATVGKVLDEVRSEVQSATGLKVPSVSDLAERIARRVAEVAPRDVQPIINATGELFSRAFGPPPLPEAARVKLSAVAHDYTNVAFDLATGEPGRAGAAVERVLRELTGAEAALVASSPGAAVVLALAALGQGREIVVARTELIETLDGDRLPDLLAASGQSVREVGMANAVGLADYARATAEGASLLLAVRARGPFSSNLAEHVALSELVRIGRDRRVPVVCYLEAASLIDLTASGLDGTPIVRDIIGQGVDVVLFSGARLVGGPPCGVIVGRKAAVEAMLKHPLAHALAADKLALAALGAVLDLYRDAPQTPHAIPLLQLLTTSADNLKNRAERLAPQLAACAAISHAEVVSAPARGRASCCIVLRPAGMTAQALAARLRDGTPPVVGRVEGDRLRLDLSSVPPRHDVDLVAAVEAVPT